MFTSSVKLQLRQHAERDTVVADDGKTDEGSVSESVMLENGNHSNSSVPYYPSVAQRIAVWRNRTTEPCHSPSGCDSALDHSAVAAAHLEFPTIVAHNGHENSPANDEENNHSFSDRLMEELTSSRKRNKKLAIKLANLERQIQQMQIDQRLRDDRLECLVASRVADTLGALISDRPLESSDSAGFIPIYQMESNKLVSMDDCQSILSYIRDHGCQLPGLDSQIQDDVQPPTGPSRRDVGTDARKCDDEEEKEDGNRPLELALSNANRELIIENAKLQETLEESESKLRHAEEECSRLRVDLGNLKNRNVPGVEEENVRLRSDLEKLRRRSEQTEAKWEREAYEMRAKYQSADEDNFRLAEELKALQRQLTRREVDCAPEDELARVSERAKLLTDENKQLMAKNEELKRLITVLRRKLSAVSGGATPSK